MKTKTQNRNEVNKEIEDPEIDDLGVSGSVRPQVSGPTGETGQGVEVAGAGKAQQTVRVASSAPQTDLQEKVGPHRVDPALAVEYSLLECALIECFVRVTPWEGSYARLRLQLNFLYATKKQLRLALVRLTEARILSVGRIPGNRGYLSISLARRGANLRGRKRAYRRFDPIVASWCQGNIVAALIAYEWLWWIKQDVDNEGPMADYHYESASRWWEHNKWAGSLSTVKRAILALTGSGILVRDPDDHPGGEPYYQVSEQWRPYVNHRVPLLATFGRRKRRPKSLAKAAHGGISASRWKGCKA